MKHVCDSQVAASWSSSFDKKKAHRMGNGVFTNHNSSSQSHGASTTSSTRADYLGRSGTRDLDVTDQLVALAMARHLAGKKVNYLDAHGQIKFATVNVASGLTALPDDVMRNIAKFLRGTFEFF